MEIIDNINRLLGDDLKKALVPGARLKIAASCFSIYAYEALKAELGKVDSLQFIFTSPTFVPGEATDKVKKERRELDMALPIATETIAEKIVFFVDGNALAACFDNSISEELVKELAKRKPLRAVFRDSSYGSDSVKINVEQIFELLSPTTEIKSL
jgi:hypothetical protein